MAKQSARLLGIGGKILTALVALVLLGKSNVIWAEEAQGTLDHSFALEASSSAFAPIAFEEDPEDLPPVQNETRCPCGAFTQRTRDTESTATKGTESFDPAPAWKVASVRNIGGYLMRFKRWLLFFYTQGTIVAALAAMVLLGKSNAAWAADARYFPDNSLELEASSSAFAPIALEEDPEDFPPCPE